MDHPAAIVTFELDPAGTSQTLRSAVAAAEHCLELWQPFLTAATPHPLHITVSTTDDPDVVFDTDRAHLQVPQSLLRGSPGQIGARILDLVVPALVTHAERHPHPQPPTFWRSAEEWEPPPQDEEPGIQIEFLDEGDVLLIGRHDGSPADADSRCRALDAYLCEHLENPGIAGRGGPFIDGSTVSWTLELLPLDHDVRF
ncbi:MAG: hypothetical protein ABW000_17290 [Actinoplanes sp.]